MKKQFLISSFLALGMGIAQAQTQSPAPAPMQSGTSDPARGSAAQQIERGSSIPPVAATNPSSDTAAPQSYKGCVNGSPGNWTLTADKGNTLTLSGTDDQLSQVKGQEVRIQGTQSSDGTFKIASIEKISDSCSSNNQASSSSMGTQSSSMGENNPGSQSSTSTTSTTQSTTTTQPPSSATENTTPSPSSTQSGANATTPDTSGQSSSMSGASSAPSVANPPVTDQTSANSVGAGTEQSAANPQASNAAGNTGQSNTGADQGVRHYSDMDQNAGQKLPQTASPLPLLGLLGLGSLVSGLIGRRKK